MDKKFLIVPGYYEWNIFYKDNLIYTIDGDCFDGLSENPTLKEIHLLALENVDGIIEENPHILEFCEYIKLVKELTKSWCEHLCVDYGEDFDTAYELTFYKKVSLDEI